MRFNLGGIVLIVLGVIFLLQNLGILRIDDIWEFWPVILIIAGISMLLPRRS